MFLKKVLKTSGRRYFCLIRLPECHFYNELIETILKYNNRVNYIFVIRGRVQHPYISSFLGFYDLRLHDSLLTYQDYSWCVLKFYFRPNLKLSFEFFGKLIILRICLAVLELIIHIPFKNNGKKKENSTTFCLGKLIYFSVY